MHKLCEHHAEFLNVNCGNM